MTNYIVATDTDEILEVEDGPLTEAEVQAAADRFGREVYVIEGERAGLVAEPRQAPEADKRAAPQFIVDRDWVFYGSWRPAIAQLIPHPDRGADDEFFGVLKQVIMGEVAPEKPEETVLTAALAKHGTALDALKADSSETWLRLCVWFVAQHGSKPEGLALAERAARELIVARHPLAAAHAALMQSGGFTLQIPMPQSQ
jgi:hypothetical protein